MCPRPIIREVRGGHPVNLSLLRFNHPPLDSSHPAPENSALIG